MVGNLPSGIDLKAAEKISSALLHALQEQRPTAGSTK